MRDWSEHLSVLWILLIKHIPACSYSKGYFLVCLLVENLTMLFARVLGNIWKELMATIPSDI